MNAKISVRFMELLFISALLSTSVISQISDDAIELTLRIQEGIFLDSTLARNIDSSLFIARSENDTLKYIHVFPKYHCTSILVWTNEQWSSAWRIGKILTGERYIDSLGTLYGLVRVETINSETIFILRFSSPLQMEKLSLLYRSHPGIIFAEPNGYSGDGDDIEYFRKEDIDHFVFSKGWGDCPAGCIDRLYRYVTVKQEIAGRNAKLEESKMRGGSYIYRWNIPAYYSMTMFPNVDSILSTIQNASEWWVRRHVIEGTWRFYVHSFPWFGEDLNTKWNTLKNELMNRRSEVISALEYAKSDSDLDVRISADTALRRISIVTSIISNKLPTKFILHQNYPNPFNSSTIISYEIPVKTNVAIKIYDLLGRNIAILEEGVKQPGKYRTEWNVSDKPSCVYFYQLAAGDFLITKKMILLK